MSRIKRSSFLPMIITIIFLLMIGFIANHYIQRNIFYPLRYVDIIDENATKYNVDPLLILAIIKAESGFDENAVSSKGAKGLMQLQDKTAEWCASKIGLTAFKLEQLYDPQVNIKLGTWYFGEYLMNYYDGDVQLALTAYNAGVGNVDKWLDNKTLSDGVNLNKIPYDETHTYLDKINCYHLRYKQLYKSY